MVSFPIVNDPQNAAFVAWTTTPWTLPSNLALCVNPSLEYVKVRNKYSGSIYVVADCSLSELPPETPNCKDYPIVDLTDCYEVLDRFLGSSLVNIKYEPLFDYFMEFSHVAFRVVCDDSVSGQCGTGVVHYAPQFGEDDFRVCLENGIINKKDLIVPVNEAGLFTEKISDYCGRYFKDADKDIIGRVKAKGRLVKSGTVNHVKAFCWRSNTPLINRAVLCWFVCVEKLKDQLLEVNRQTYWVPDFVKDKRFHNWLENARDWAISRSRFWGTPIPVWISEDGEEILVIDSVDKLERFSGVKVVDLHRENVDNITIPSCRGSEFGVLRRVDDVFDCWFESGSMPYAYIHYPFENTELFENNFPGHFVAEGIDQTRGWFYALTVLATALFGKPAFRNLICNGFVLAEDGKKMSKQLNNYPSPMDVINDYGADALRLYLINSPVVHAEDLYFKKEGVNGVVKDVFLPWYNVYRFLVQNCNRLDAEGSPFIPSDLASVQVSPNVLDQWISSATHTLVSFVRKEMDGYRLYTVVPYLLKFLDYLTNVYVRFNRKRLKGLTGEEDCQTALSTLYNVLLVTCKVMAPFTPFFTEVLYQNMRRVCNGSEESIHYCSFPEAEGKTENKIERSVQRMITVIDLARNIRDRQKKPIKDPLREMIVVHPDADFLNDIATKLKQYVLDELNVKTIVPCNDVLKYADLRAEPNYSVLGRRLGRDMGAVAKGVKAMSQSDILAFEEAGEAVVAMHSLKMTDIKVFRDFKRPLGMDACDIDAAGDGDVLVILDLRSDDSLRESCVAREIVSGVQKLRKRASLEPKDAVNVYLESPDKAVIQQVLKSQEKYIGDALGSRVIFLMAAIDDELQVISEGNFRSIYKVTFRVILTKC
ncbi:unnamed protein product [Cuscuta epithymum]|nr:unnamed protein product [Cuscuta epithymum]